MVRCARKVHRSKVPNLHTIGCLNKRKRVALSKRRLKKRKLKARAAASR